MEKSDNTSSVNEVVLKKKKSRRREYEDEEDIDTCVPKKQRIVWSLELHQKFVDVVNQLADDQVVPTKILELMNVPGLRRANVASHLQKYRLYLTMLRDDLPQQNQNNEININSPYIGSSNTHFGTISSSFHDIDFQGQPIGPLITGHSLVTLHRPSNISPSLSIAEDERNMFTFECPNLGFSDGDLMSLIRGIPTTMDPKQQLASLNQSNVSGNLLLNGFCGVDALGRDVSCTFYNSPSMVDFSSLYDNSFQNFRGTSSHSLGEGLQDDVNVGSKCFVPNYYELQQYGSHHYVGHCEVGDGFNPNFGMPSNFDTQFTVESLPDTSCSSNIFSHYLCED